MRRFFVIVIVVLSVLLEPSGIAAKLRWQETKLEVAGRSLTDPRYTDGIEIFGNNGVITIRTTHRIQVRVFTILGQLVSQSVLNAGTSELHVGSRGIYLVKIGNSITQKVAL